MCGMRLTLIPKCYSLQLFIHLHSQIKKAVISIFLVEGHHNIGKHFELLLQGETNFMCHAFRTAEDALSQLKGTPDFVLMDVNLPGMSGITGEVYRRA